MINMKKELRTYELDRYSASVVVLNNKVSLLSSKSLDIYDLQAMIGEVFGDKQAFELISETKLITATNVSHLYRLEPL